MEGKTTEKVTFFIVQTPYHIDDPEVSNMLGTLGDINRDNHYEYSYIAVEGKFCENLNQLMKLVIEGFIDERGLVTGRKERT